MPADPGLSKPGPLRTTYCRFRQAPSISFRLQKNIDPIFDLSSALLRLGSTVTGI
jgi:hypothetical protein